MQKVLAVIGVVAVGIVVGQWLPDQRLTTDTTASITSLSNNARNVAAQGDTVHVTWLDGPGGSEQVWYKRSVDAGATWTADTQLTNSPARPDVPSISAAGATVCVVWSDIRNGHDADVYFKCSTNGGATWGSEVRLTSDTADQEYASVSASGSSVHVVWTDTRLVKYQVYYRHSTDRGVTWSNEVMLPSDTAGAENATVVASGSSVHVFWKDYRSGSYEVYYKRSIDGGTTWDADRCLVSSPTLGAYPTAAVSGSNVHVVWLDFPGNYEIYHKGSTDGGTTWSADHRVSNNDSVSWSPSVGAAGSTCHVTWYDGRQGDLGLYYRKSTDAGGSWGPETRLTTCHSMYPFPVFHVAASRSAAHVVWYDNRDGNDEIYYKRNVTGAGLSEGSTISVPGRPGHALTITPNPSRGSLVVLRCDMEHGVPLRIRLIDVLGRSLIERPATPTRADEVSLDIGHLAAGVYVVELCSDLGHGATALLVRH
ncbi:MAG TPA: hypothetical protein VMH22_03915 [bacterium]|nr:hypothetical protein [bacterium]